MEEETFRRYICVCLESRRRHVDGIDILPYDMFLNELWEGRYIHELCKYSPCPEAQLQQRRKSRRDYGSAFQSALD